MTTPRTSPYMYVTWIPRYLTGEKSCLFAAWFKANHQGYAKMPSDFDSAKWNRLQIVVIEGGARCLGNWQ